MYVARFSFSRSFFLFFNSARTPEREAYRAVYCAMLLYDDLDCCVGIHLLLKHFVIVCVAGYFFILRFLPLIIAMKLKYFLKSA